jgi:hypothetical protein
MLFSSSRVPFGCTAPDGIVRDDVFVRGEVNKSRLSRLTFNCRIISGRTELVN